MCGVERTGRRSARARAAQRHVEGADGVGVGRGPDRTGTRAATVVRFGPSGLLGTLGAGPFLAAARPADA